MKMHSTIVIAALLVAGCNGDETTVDGPSASTTIEMQLYAMGKDTTGFTFYKNSTDTLSKAGNSGHPDPKLRTRYNAVAARSLDSVGKVKARTVFPESSLIVKELFTNDVLTTYVFMLKRTGDNNADANGWVWAETYASGSTLYAASNKGFGCINCHSIGIDYTRMNDTHP